MIVTVTALPEIKNFGILSALISFISTRNISLPNTIPVTMPADNAINAIYRFS